MLPLLRRYREASVSFSDRSYPRSIFVERATRDEDWDEVTNAVRAGKILGED